MPTLEIWTRQHSSDILTREIYKDRYKIHTLVSTDDITRERFDQLVKEKGFTLLNTIVL